MDNISTDGIDVLGVTSVDDELFVLLHRDYNQVAVYSTNDYQLLRHLNLPGLKPHEYSDLTSCVRHTCLYMSDFDGRCVYRYDLASSAKRNAISSWFGRATGTSKWPVPGKPCGLSVTPGCSLLVTCQRPGKLVELSADSGQCVREIALQSDIVGPWQGIQLTTGQFVVCHGDSFQRVCVVGADGRIARSYGGVWGPSVSRLFWPSHVAVDRDSQFVFVADQGNDRVVLLSPTLEFVRSIREELSDPSRLYLHQATRRLYVGLRQVNVGHVVIIQL